MTTNVTMLGLTLSPNQKQNMDFNLLEKKIHLINGWGVTSVIPNINIQFTSISDEGKIDVIIESSGEISCYISIKSDFFVVDDLLRIWNTVVYLINELNITIEYKYNIEVYVQSNYHEDIYNKNEEAVKGFINTLYNQSVNSVRDYGTADNKMKFFIETRVNENNYITTVFPYLNLLLSTKSLKFEEISRSSTQGQYVEFVSKLYPKAAADKFNMVEQNEKNDGEKNKFDELADDQLNINLQSMVQEALKNIEMEREYRRTIAVDDQLDGLGMPRIMIVGCGGAGNNTINRLYNIGIDGAETIAINSDKLHLDTIRADKKILVGKMLTRGLGAGGYPEVGAKAAELARDVLENILKDSDLVFITAGMGGGTGTGVAPVIAEIAKEQGAIVIGMVSSPFRVERSRTVKAEEGIENLRKVADTVIVLDNNRLLEYVPNLPIEQAFSVMDQLIAETVKGITETITQPSLINIDYADIRAIMGCGGVAVMLVGESKNKDKSNDVVRIALNHPLLDVDYRGATGSLVHITGGLDLSLKEAEEIASSLTSGLSPNANVIWGARIREDYEGKVRVIAIMTGVHSAQILGPNDRVSEIAQTKNVETDNAYVYPTAIRKAGFNPFRQKINGRDIIDKTNKK